MNGVLGSINLSGGPAQSIYVCDSTGGAVVTVSACNRGKTSAFISIAVTSVMHTVTSAEWIEYKAEVYASGVLERSGIAVSQGDYVIIKSTNSNVTAMCWGTTVGSTITVPPLTVNTGLAPVWVTPTAFIVVVGKSYQLSATDPDNGDNMTYSVDSGALPSGVSLGLLGELTATGATGYSSSGILSSATITANDGFNTANKTFNITKKWLDGSTAEVAVPNGLYLYNNIGPANLASGTYWLNLTGTPAQYYVDMTSGAYAYYNEGTDCRNFIANWNDSGVYNMTSCATFGNCYIHGWGGSARTYTLTLANLPTHTLLRVSANIHMIDSWDGETNYVNVTADNNSQQEFIRWTKSYGNNNIGGIVQGTALFPNNTYTYYNAQSYSYSPLGYSTNNGYVTVNSGLYSHTRSNLTANFYTGLDQATSDESYYISHVKIELI
jgi:hypothetical protein